MGILDREIQRVKNGRVLLIPDSDLTSGHDTTFQAQWWKWAVDELLKNSPHR